jgi:hypothetical protein
MKQVHYSMVLAFVTVSTTMHDYALVGGDRAKKPGLSFGQI